MKPNCPPEPRRRDDALVWLEWCISTHDAYYVAEMPYPWPCWCDDGDDDPCPAVYDEVRAVVTELRAYRNAAASRSLTPTGSVAGGMLTSVD